MMKYIREFHAKVYKKPMMPGLVPEKPQLVSYVAEYYSKNQASDLKNTMQNILKDRKGSVQVLSSES